VHYWLIVYFLSRARFQCASGWKARRQQLRRCRCTGGWGEICMLSTSTYKHKIRYSMQPNYYNPRCT